LAVASDDLVSHDIDACVARLISAFDWTGTRIHNPRRRCGYHSNANGMAEHVMIMVICAQNAHATISTSADADKHFFAKHWWLASAASSNPVVECRIFNSADLQTARSRCIPMEVCKRKASRRKLGLRAGQACPWG
jgi:hypothetical protein